MARLLDVYGVSARRSSHLALLSVPGSFGLAIWADALDLDDTGQICTVGLPIAQLKAITVLLLRQGIHRGFVLFQYMQHRFVLCWELCECGAFTSAFGD